MWAEEIRWASTVLFAAHPLQGRTASEGYDTANSAGGAAIPTEEEIKAEGRG